MATRPDPLPPPLPSAVRPPPLPPVSPAPSPPPVLAYYRPFVTPPADWTVVASCQTVAEWHSTRQALTAASIDARMYDGRDAIPGANAGARGPDLLVKREDVPLARAILDARLSGRPFCPRCSSLAVRRISVAWYWYAFAVLFLGFPPIWPASKLCETCGNKWN